MTNMGNTYFNFFVSNGVFDKKKKNTIGENKEDF